MFEQAFINIDHIFHNDAGCSSELDYTEQASWMLFLKYLDDLEKVKSLVLKGIIYLRRFIGEFDLGAVLFGFSSNISTIIIASNKSGDCPLIFLFISSFGFICNLPS